MAVQLIGGPANVAPEMASGTALRRYEARRQKWQQERCEVRRQDQASRTAKPLPNRSISGRWRPGSRFNLRMAQETAFRRFPPFAGSWRKPGRFATLTLIARNPGIISQTDSARRPAATKSSLDARG